MGLSDPLKDELARVGIPQTLDELINLSIQIDRRLRERRSERSSSHPRPIWMLPRVPGSPNQLPLSSTPATEAPEPMQLGLLQPSLTPEERMRRRTHNLCLYCGEQGHFVRTCPNKIRKCLTSSSSCASVLPKSGNHLTISVVLQLPGKNIPVSVMQWLHRSDLC